MNELLKPENLYLMLFFFFPGFISLKVYDHLVPNEKRNFSHDFFEAISYGAINLIMILGNNISSVAFYKPQNEVTNNEQKT